MDLKESNEQQTNRNQDSFSMHSQRIFIFLILGGISTLFLSLTMAYAYARFENGIKSVAVPFIFYVNSITLLLSSVTLSRARSAYLRDHFSHFQKLIIATIVLSIIFLGLQIFGWQKLFALNLDLVSNARSYLYLISGLHFIHLLAGLPFLLSFYKRASQISSDEVERLLYLSDHRIEERLRAIIIYWHFLDVLWIYLLVFFGVNSLL